MHFSDEQLMLLYARGRREAFDELFTRHHGRVYAFLARMVGAPGADAEDLVQETFLRVARAAGSYRPTARFTTWLFRVATNCGLQLLERRRRGPHLRVVRGDGSLEEPRGAALDPAAAWEAREAEASLARAVAGLPERQRAVFLLRQSGGLSYEEIAEALDLTVANVKTNLHRARARLVGDLGEYLAGAASPRSTRG